MGALFLAGLAGGVTHCAGMCAPFVLARRQTGRSAAWAAPSWRGSPGRRCWPGCWPWRRC
ncbi:sulfite exporter TauE/SafE family protein [Roseomonas sp. GC11]|uniref:urease accessory protein UreH domain-containing protein n=1 Tax=Roseomonas sp. GC11 TaxID=2950546 RepID=UPI00210EDD3A|nr:sulfite exporter TauE/SafE family protein [Roseomonas sp. GC11]MCQ4161512.1 sulfite exporter TauE/SafE family protein [Roseomonas sp. GC11]